MQYFEQCVRPKKNNNKAKLRPALYVRTIALWIKKNFTECPFWAVSAHRTTVLAHFWLFPPLWIISIEDCVLRAGKIMF
jgi:hypothetical protein